MRTAFSKAGSVHYLSDLLEGRCWIHRSITNVAAGRKPPLFRALIYEPQAGWQIRTGRSWVLVAKPSEQLPLGV